MGLFGAIGNAVKAPVNRVAGKIPGLGAVNKQVQRTPGMGMMGRGLGIGPSSPPSGGMNGMMNSVGQMGQRPLQPLAPPIPQNPGGVPTPDQMPNGGSQFGGGNGANPPQMMNAMANTPSNPAPDPRMMPQGPQSGIGPSFMRPQINRRMMQQQ